jgi:hypothetical protein
MNLLVIGSGGREHAMAWRLAQSPRIGRVYVAPGNAGTAHEDGLFNVSLTAIPDLVDFALKEAIALTVVGPQASSMHFAPRDSRYLGPPVRRRNWRRQKISPRHSWSGTAFQPPRTRLSPMRKRRMIMSRSTARRL